MGGWGGPSKGQLLPDPHLRALEKHPVLFLLGVFVFFYLGVSLVCLFYWVFEGSHGETQP